MVCPVFNVFVISKINVSVFIRAVYVGSVVGGYSYKTSRLLMNDTS